jgi:S1-C subfamily serine protease
VSATEVTPAARARFRIEEPFGAVVENVEEGPAREAGFRAGDVIVEMEGLPVRTFHVLRSRVARAPIGQRASFVVLREGERVDLTAEIGPAPE